MTTTDIFQKRNTTPVIGHVMPDNNVNISIQIKIAGTNRIGSKEYIILASGITFSK
jgi:hypothetical protein